MTASDGAGPDREAHGRRGPWPTCDCPIHAGAHQGCWPPSVECPCWRASTPDDREREALLDAWPHLRLEDPDTRDKFIRKLPPSAIARLIANPDPARGPHVDDWARIDRAAWDRYENLRAALDRARDAAALLESELAGAVVPQVLTAETPEPPRPWTLVYANTATVGPSSRSGDTWALALALVLPDGRPVFVISARAGDHRG